MDSIISKLVEKVMNDRAKWIDGTIQDAVPKWKLDLLQKINHSLLRKFIRGDIEIINETLIADFGTKVIIKLNGKVIGERNYK